MSDNVVTSASLSGIVEIDNVNINLASLKDDVDIGVVSDEIVDEIVDNVIVGGV